MDQRILDMIDLLKVEKRRNEKLNKSAQTWKAKYKKIEKEHKQLQQWVYDYGVYYPFVWCCNTAERACLCMQRICCCQNVQVVSVETQTMV